MNEHDLSHVVPASERAALIYDVDAIRRRTQMIRTLSEVTQIEFLLSTKACSEPMLLREFRDVGVGFDISNLGELSLLNSAFGNAYPRAAAIATGPDLIPLAQSVGDIDGIIFFADSLGQLEDLLDCNVNIGIRLHAGDLCSRFGMSAADVNCLPDRLLNRIKGVQVHFEESQDFPSVFRKNIQLIKLVVRDVGLRPIRISLGGGLHRASKGELLSLLVAYRESFSESVSLSLEPGDFWFCGCGYAMATILNVVRESERVYRVVTTLSSTCHLRWSAPDLMIGSHISSAGEKSTISDIVRLVGPTCDESDVLGVYEIPTGAAACFETGERLFFKNVTPYSASWNHSFNGIREAKVIWHGFE